MPPVRCLWCGRVVCPDPELHRDLHAMRVAVRKALTPVFNAAFDRTVLHQPEE